ncbi:dihydrolipoyllysine-residue acetyltransferase [Teredinibacter haidensis]|uniref:dihydrolipoyllysine-residue acetyltransferase n=1 Tax=Teredinibacter haidensis TaxID=2731755 RepID=UPI0009489BD2|nr:dihydrolipoyllysine-residue acetyltransferase [Teredinibacter haidensis]
MAKQIIQVPDIGGSENVDVIEICVAPGDTVALEDSLMVLESDKASMEIPSPLAGTVVNVLIQEGGTVSEGDNIIEIETEAEEAAAEPVAAEPAPVAAPSAPAAAAAVAPASVTGGEETITVPDIGGSEGVDVIEVCVAVGDDVSEGDSLIVLESDKASMEIPSPATGKVVSLSIIEGGKVSMGDDILVLATTSGGAEPIAEAPPAVAAESIPAAASAEPAPVVSGGVIDVNVPDIGGAQGVGVIEVCVAEGDEVSEGDSLIVLESDKASMEIPAAVGGKVVSLLIKEGDKASEGTAILKLEVVGIAPTAEVPTAAPPVHAPAKPKTSSERHPQEIVALSADVYAGPAVRQLARQLGVDLTKVKATGPRGRIAKEDLRNFVKSVMKQKASGSTVVSGGAGIPAVPEVDFSQFGEIEMVKMSKIKKLTAANMSRNWLNVPHVTQFDDADITDLESFRKNMKAEAEKKGVKLTPLPFLLKACAAALRAEPKFNASLHVDGEHIVQKNYVHIGVAVDTPNGLMVPVIRDVDQKGLFELAKESVELATKAREGKLMPRDMQGGCFTISSLGPIGGTGFTPIVNAPEVAILGVSKASIQPVWNGSEFMPRQMLPLALSYDHRAINGVDAGKFFTFLSSVLADVRKLLL